jgi:phage terminase large subunit GpA-like protein
MTKELVKSSPLRGRKGLPEGPIPTSIPVASKPSGVMSAVNGALSCPHCGCRQIMEIHQETESEMLRGGKGLSMFLGCPACPWASEMLTIASSPSDKD